MRTPAALLLASGACSKSPPRLGNTQCTVTSDCCNEAVCAFGLAHARKCTCHPQSANARNSECVRTPAALLLASGHRKLTNSTERLGVGAESADDFVSAEAAVMVRCAFRANTGFAKRRGGLPW